MNISKHEIITEDEIDINVDDDDPFDKTFNAKSESMNLNKFSFSISNILSDTFGPKPVKIEPTFNERNIFRPFEIKNFISNDPISVSSKSVVQNPSSVFLSNFRLSEIFDYSTKHSSHQIKSDNSLRNSLYNSLASYPKIHEEILNSHKKFANTQPASSLLSTPPKLPPLGGLCKTISQIGQENFSQSPQSSFSSTNLLQPKSNLSDSLKIQQSSTDSMDSDDCASEASTSTKDESQKMWPAWVSVYITCFSSLKLTYYVRFASFFKQIFCTRYSDRPSSGNCLQNKLENYNNKFKANDSIRKYVTICITFALNQ